jgi:hypothetical protein
MSASLNGPSGRVDLITSVLTIGRAPDNQLVMNDSQASSRHAEIRQDTQGYTITDLGSTNGTYVNEQRLVPQVPQRLQSGSIIRIGTTQYTFQEAGSYAPTLMASTEYPSPGYAPTVAVPPPANPYSSPNQGYASPYTDYSAGYPPPSAYPGAQNAYASPYQQPPAPGMPGQYPYAPAPGTPVTPPVTTQKSRRNLYIIIGVVVLALILAVGGVVYANRSTPDKTLATFCNDLQSGDYHGAYQQLSQSFQQQDTESQFVNFFNSNKVSTCTYTGPVTSGNQATSTLTIQYVNGRSEVDHLTLTQDSANGNNWRISNAQTGP